MRRRAKKFFKTPKGLLIIVLAIFVAMSAPSEGITRVWPGILTATIAAGLVDLLILRIRKKVWEFPAARCSPL